MAITGHEEFVVQGEGITVDLIIWRRYRTAAPRMTEITMDLNPHVALLHAESPFLPVGTRLRIPVDLELLRGRPEQKSHVTLYNSRT